MWTGGATGWVRAGLYYLFTPVSHVKDDPMKSEYFLNPCVHVSSGGRVGAIVCVCGGGGGG